MCDLCDEYEVPRLHVCILCISNTDIFVEAVWAAEVEIDTHIGDDK